MATGPEHYKRADDIMQSLAKGADEGVNLPFAHAQTLLAQAQVHATLALAAATAMSAGLDAPRMHDFDWEAWDAVAGTQEPDDDPNDENALWVRTDLSDVMQTAEIHTAPMPGDEPHSEDGPF